VNITDLRFWEKAWNEAREASFLMSTQKADPKRWFEFYNEISDIYQSLWDSRNFADTVVKIFLSQGLIRPGDKVLDAGCGPGTLAIPLAAQGMQVTGLDYSPGMLETLRKEAEALGLKPVRTVCESFEAFRPDTLYDLVCAAFFPPSLEPEGLKRLESWSQGWCAVMVGAGEKERPLHNALWRAVMNTEMNKEPYSGKFHLICVTGWLMAGGRMPCINYISQRYKISRPFEEMLRFYKAYFAIFGHRDKETEKVISDILERYTVAGGREQDAKNYVESEEDIHTAVIVWRTI